MLFGAGLAQQERPRVRLSDSDLRDDLFAVLTGHGVRMASGHADPTEAAMLGRLHHGVLPVQDTSHIAPGDDVHIAHDNEKADQVEERRVEEDRQEL